MHQCALLPCLAGKHAPQTIWPWLLQRMEQASSNDRLRIVLLVIYRHLVYAFGSDPPSSPFDHKSLLVSSLRPTLNTATIKVGIDLWLLRDRWLDRRSFIDHQVSVAIDRRHGLPRLPAIGRSNLSHRVHRTKLHLSNDEQRRWQSRSSCISDR